MSESAVDRSGCHRRSRATTGDGVSIHFVETGNPTGLPIIFVHGISQSWKAWAMQLEDPVLRSRFRLIALDLRGHGDSQGAQGARDAEGRSSHLLSPDRYNDGTSEGTARLWAGDIAAVVSSLGLSEFALVGWSYGGAVVLDYLYVHDGLKTVSKVILVATSAVIQPPGVVDGGADRIFTARAIKALMRTTPMDYTLTPPRDNEASDIVSGITEYITTCLADDTQRRIATRQEIDALTSFNMLTAPDVRLSIMNRSFDYRTFLDGLPSNLQQRITVITPLGDKVLQVANTITYWPSRNITRVPIGDEGHFYFRRNPEDFCQRLLSALCQ